MPALVRVVFCGAVDDGKSSLLGRLLAETGSVALDDLASVTTNETPDYSRLTDGLSAEREQGITIDVAYRHIALPSGRRALLADCPGHDQYTRNMAVAASSAQVAVLVVDATRGPRPQSYRHAAICALMGVERLVVAVTKTDAVADPVAAYAAARTFAAEIAERSYATVDVVPVSAVLGDNVAERSTIAEYAGPTLLELLDDAAVADGPADAPDRLRLPVQAVARQDGERWYVGRLAAGRVESGDHVRVAISGATARVAEVRGASAVTRGSAVSVRLDRELDLRRGDLLIPDDDHPTASRAYLADVVWLDLDPQRPEGSYLLRCGPLEVPARIDVVRYSQDVVTDEQAAVERLEVNDLGRVEIVLDRPLILEPYARSHDTGGFVLVDRRTARTVAAGMVVHGLSRESDVVRHRFQITRADREQDNGVRGCVLWLTGLPGSGKSTIADALATRLREVGVRSYILDGDAVRSSLSDDLGFSPADRTENVRRVARVAEMMLDAGLVTIVSLVSPFRSDRELAKELFAAADFFEIFVDTPLEVCRERDPKNLYSRAAVDGSIALSGVSQAYEEPEQPDLVIDGRQPLEISVDALLGIVLLRRV